MSDSSPFESALWMHDYQVKIMALLARVDSATTEADRNNADREIDAVMEHFRAEIRERQRVKP